MHRGGGACRVFRGRQRAARNMSDASDQMDNDSEKAEEILTGEERTFTHQVRGTDFIHRQRGTLKRTEEGKAWSVRVARQLKRPLCHPGSR